jgi:hypothetical protein
MASVALTTAKAFVRINLKGFGTATINWGEKIENITLSKNGVAYSQKYAYSATRTIKITITSGILRGLRCDCNELIGTLDVSSLSGLRSLFCHNNQLDTLKFSDVHYQLRTLVCYNNRLKTLTGFPTEHIQNLKVLICSNNLFTNLDISKSRRLQTLVCSRNSGLNSLDVSKNQQLKTLVCSSNVLASLSVSGNTALEKLACERNKLVSLNVSGLIKLRELGCNDNALSSLNAGGLPNLAFLDCSRNVLASLSVSGDTALDTLFCNENKLSSLSVSGLSKLRDLRCYVNVLASLNVIGCSALEALYCYANKLEELSVSGLSKLKILNCTSNILFGIALDDLFVSLNSTTCVTKNLFILGNFGVVSCNLSIATNKGWIVDCKSSSASLNEDCIYFDYSKTAISSDGTAIVQGSMLMLYFGKDAASARKALDIIKFYKFTHQCFVGRPNAPMQYFLCNGKSPVGAFSGEDAIDFTPSAVVVKKIGNSWKVVEGDHWIMDFASNEANALKALAVIQKYGFNKICFVGRPNPPMTYFRR